ncbi:NAD(P)H-dependent oxidoreductase [Halomonas sp. THAF12]|uniref:NAD(P)H-dependent oxidoreductase n=1 Tax=Halomonas sp. B23F22_10 TaxID=3459515 RepID=UPI00373FB0F4
MSSRILILQGHPDHCAEHLCHALADHYRRGAEKAGHEVAQLDIATLDVPLLRSRQEWQASMPSEPLAEAQRAILHCDHLVMVFPLWLGDMPAMLKAFLEQVLRPGFAFEYEAGDPLGHKGLTGRSARIIVTMGMPSVIYRHLYRAHSVKSLERNILGFVGFAPVRETLIGSVDNQDETARARWFEHLERLGAAAR